MNEHASVVSLVLWFGNETQYPDKYTTGTERWLKAYYLTKFFEHFLCFLENILKIVHSKMKITH